MDPQRPKYLESRPASPFQGLGVPGRALRGWGLWIPALVALGLVATTAATAAGAGRAKGRNPGGTLAPVDLGRRNLLKALSSPGSTLVGKSYQTLEHLERRFGNRDGQLAPRDLDKADVLTQQVMAGVYRRLGRKTLALEEVRKALPEAMLELAIKGRKYPELRPLFEAASKEALDTLSQSYRSQVLGGKSSVTEFCASVGLRVDDLLRLRERSPRLFPVERKVDSSNAPEIARQYKILHEGKINYQTFYARTGLTKKKLFSLQASHPDLFPRDREVYKGNGKVTVGTRNVKVDEAELSRLWKERVVTRLVTAGELADDLGISRGTFSRLQRQNPKAFPKVPNLPIGSRPLDEESAHAFGKKAAEIFLGDVTLDRQGICDRINQDATLVARFGKIDMKRYEGLQKFHPKAFPDVRDNKVILGALAAEVKAILKKEPGLTPKEIEQRLSAGHAAFRPWRLVALRTAYPNLIPKQKEAAARGDERARDAEKLKLILDRDPSRTIADVSRELGKKNPRYTQHYLSNLRVDFKLGHEKIVKKDVRRDSLPILDLVRLVGRLAPAGTSPEKIMSVMNGLLEERGLEPLAKDAPLPPEWKRALAGKQTRSDRQLAELSQSVGIPMRLPMLDNVVKELDGKTPLMNKNVLWVSHLFGSTYTMGRALHEAGAAYNSTVVVGSPYGTNGFVKDAMKADGYDVRVPKLDVKAYRAAVQKAVDDTIARHRDNHNSIVVMDDGGLVADILRSDEKYAPYRSQFKIVEQTTSGITAAEKAPIDFSIVNVARSKSKAYEGSFIGRVVASKLVQGMARLDKPLKGETVAVFGYGFIGTAIAKELKERGATVQVVDPSENAATIARAKGFRVVDKATALSTSSLVVGATGTRSLTVDDLRLLKDGAVVASASSKQIEIDMQGLAKAGRRTLLRLNTRAHLPNARYQLGSRRITVLGDGWPVNFDGSIEGVPHEEIQLTLAAMLQGAIQAAGINGAAGRNKASIVPLDHKVDKKLFSSYVEWEIKKYKEKPISNPDDWRDVIKDVERRFK